MFMSLPTALKARQIKAARALLDWSQEDLAKVSGLSIATIRKLELGNISPRGKTNEHICHSFEDAGLEFIDPNGVRQRPEEIFVYHGETGFGDFWDDVYEVSRRTCQDVIQVWPSARQIIKVIGKYRAPHAERMIAIQDRVKVKCILTEDSEYHPSVYVEHRFLSRHFVDSVPFYVYGDKYAIIPEVADDNTKIIVIQSRTAAQAFRRQFKSMWERATPLENMKDGAKASKK